MVHLSAMMSAFTSAELEALISTSFFTMRTSDSISAALMAFRKPSLPSVGTVIVTWMFITERTSSSIVRRSASREMVALTHSIRLSSAEIVTVPSLPSTSFTSMAREAVMPLNWPTSTVFVTILPLPLMRFGAASEVPATTISSAVIRPIK